MDGFRSTYTMLESIGGALLSPQMSLILQASLSLVFLISGIYKLRHPVAAAASAVLFGLPVSLTRTTGLALGASEFLLGISLLVPTRQVALLALGVSAALCVGFTVITSRALHRGESFECSCLGEGSVSKLSVMRAGAMLTAALLAISGMEVNERLVTLEFASTAICVALALVCAPYLGGLIRKLRRTHGGFRDRVDWGWLMLRIGETRGGS